MIDHADGSRPEYQGKMIAPEFTNFQKETMVAMAHAQAGEQYFGKLRIKRGQDLKEAAASLEKFSLFSELSLRLDREHVVDSNTGNLTTGAILSDSVGDKNEFVAVYTREKASDVNKEK